MSTTMPSSSRSGRRKVASTTKVAPCSRWAGPNTSPWKLCATIMWSRTVTENTSGTSVVADQVTQGRELARGELRQHVRQLLEPGGPGQQHVVRRVGEQLQREGHPLLRRTTTAAGCGHRADLARPDRQPVGVEPAPQPERDLRVAVPAQLDDRALRDQEVERELQPGRAGAGVHDEVLTGRR